MIRVFVERKIKKAKDIGRVLQELHMIAVQQKGHISNETLMNVRDNHVITVQSTWKSIDDWNAWESSKERAEIIKKIKPLLAEKTKVTIYEMMSPEDLDYYIDPENWMQEHERPHFEG